MKYNPSRYLIVKITTKENEIFYKIFATFYGGYTDGDSYRFSSRIEYYTEIERNVTILNDTRKCKEYLFKNHSGSIYSCIDGTEGASGWSSGVLEYYKKKVEESGHSLEILSKDQWKKELIRNEQ